MRFLSRDYLVSVGSVWGGGGGSHLGGEGSPLKILEVFFHVTFMTPVGTPDTQPFRSEAPTVPVLPANPVCWQQTALFQRLNRTSNSFELRPCACSAALLFTMNSCGNTTSPRFPHPARLKALHRKTSGQRQ